MDNIEISDMITECRILIKTMEYSTNSSGIPDNIVYVLTEVGDAQAGLNVMKNSNIMENEQYHTYCTNMIKSVEVSYGYYSHNVDCVGRMNFRTSYNSSICAATISKNIRYAIFHGKTEIDFVNCQPTIFYNLLVSFGIDCPMLEKYVKNREEMLSSHPEIKSIVLRIMFGMGLSAIKVELGLSDLPQFIIDFHNEFKINVDKYIAHDRELYKLCMKEFVMSCLLKKEEGLDIHYNTKMRIFARMIQTYEARNVRKLVELLMSNGINVYSIIYDAVICDNVEDVVVGVIGGLQTKINIIPDVVVSECDKVEVNEEEVRQFTSCNFYDIVIWLMKQNITNIVKSADDGEYFTYDNDRRIWVKYDEHDIFANETIYPIINNRRNWMLETRETNVKMRKLISNDTIRKMHVFYTSPTNYSKITKMYIDRVYKFIREISLNGVLDLIAFEDKVINLKTREVRDRIASDYFTHVNKCKIVSLDENDVIFDNIKKLIKNASRDASGNDRLDLEEFHHINLGSCLIGKCSSMSHNGMVSYLKGDGNDGKSVLYFNLLNVCMSAPFFQQTTIFTSAERNDPNGHAANLLFLKYARCALTNEPSVRTVINGKKFIEFNTNIFLNATDCMTFTGRGFGSGKQKSFNFQAKIVIISNFGPKEIPTHIDKRLMFIPFNVHFPTSEENPEEYEKNKIFCDEIMTKPDVIFSFLIIGAIKYTEGRLNPNLPCILEAKQDIKASLIVNQDNVNITAMESIQYYVNSGRITLNNCSYEPVSEVYDHYLAFCLKMGITNVLAKNKFSSPLIEYYNSINDAGICLRHTNKGNYIDVKLL